jgi:hypothetical protein
MIDNISFEQYKKYKEYIEQEILKLTGISKDYLENVQSNKKREINY